MAQPLWSPSPERIAQTNLTRFLALCREKYSREWPDYAGLHRWSCNHPEEFWATVWEFGQVIAATPYAEVVQDFDRMPGAQWFTGARLNFAENLLRHKGPELAFSFTSESGQKASLTYAELNRQVARAARTLRSWGVGPGDRVAGYTPNMIPTAVAMLAAASLGAVWSSCSPDFGFKGVMDRFGQIQPKVLFAANGYFYGGKTFDCLERAAHVGREIDSIQKIVIFPYTAESPDLAGVPGGVSWDEFLGADDDPPLEFAHLPFDHPLYILYSSGTTGMPKCIVHGAGGTLVQHLKELWLHSDLKFGDKMFYFTTCGWMMWNWLMSSLTAGATLVLFDGSPFQPGPEALWRLAEEEGINIFGTSARYLAAVENAGFRPGEACDLSALKTILSTGSPLSAEQFSWCYQAVKGDMCLSSISGGTDIVGCFAGGNPNLPVYAGQLQCRQLGMAVEAWNPERQPVVGEKAELVCTRPFPSMPIYFWNDSDQAKYRAAYFENFPGVWCHGDFCEITPEDGVIIYGRSDATLNPGGVRIGTAEIYRQVEGLAEVADSLVVGQNWDNDVRVVLFLRMNPGFALDEALAKKIKTAIRQNASPRHVPAKILEVADIPYTISGKKVELAVKNVIHGLPVLNKDALANPASLDLFVNRKELGE
ncbi:MAG: acetoacetate--CoA ligase [Deltaproteobacteria bacterium]|nr:acetoacetate--CoA ligase [Deltaproteobacteria bacterium]